MQSLKRVRAIKNIQLQKPDRHQLNVIWNLPSVTKNLIFCKLERPFISVYKIFNMFYIYISNSKNNNTPSTSTATRPATKTSVHSASTVIQDKASTSAVKVEPKLNSLMNDTSITLLNTNADDTLPQKVCNTYCIFKLLFFYHFSINIFWQLIRGVF